MSGLSPRLGVCSWSLAPKSTDDLIARLQYLGLNKVQLAFNAHRGEAGSTEQAITRLTEAGIAVVSGMFGTLGEDYSTLQTIRLTGGLALDEHWSDNLAIAQRAADLAAAHGIAAVSFHAGFIPEDHDDPDYLKVRGRLQSVADVFAQRNVRLLFETGQETADALDSFLDDLNRPGVGVNFDPANMILYAKGDPVASLKKLLPRVAQIHLKDATATSTPGTWGTEVPVGSGQVDWPAFVQVLRAGNYEGDLIIEREAGATREADIQTAAQVITELL